MIDHVGKVVYECYFSVPTMSSERYRLRIGAASHKCRVYLNGDLIGTGINGYIPIDCPLENLQELNRLSVVIDNRLTFQTLLVGRIDNGKQIINHDFYNFTGIHRDVCVYTLPEKCIEDIIINTVLDGDYSKVSVELVGNVTNPVYIIKDNVGEKILESSTTLFTIPEVQLWSPERPYLYTLRVQTETDCYEEPFGVRKIELKGNQLLLNDKPVYLKGFGMHEDFFLTGKGNCTRLVYETLNA